jgi:UDP-N-acetylglucosamine--N-acetylmuramyl-(pentapeptide) pyrophosphoryl-undecaprenol N-acetylglucosamine transferase
MPNKIMLTGGGTLGPVTPLLAVASAWKQADPTVEFVWVGTRFGPDRGPVEAADIRFLHIPVFRLPRHPTLEWFALPFRFAAALVMSWLIIGREQPDLIASAGGYTGVPLIWIGKLRGKKVWIHQQDVTPSLASRLSAPFADCITVAWQRLLSRFSKKKTDWIGNPVRESILQGKKDIAHEAFGIDLSRPTVFVFGGGTGATWLNHMMEQVGGALTEQANVIHVTGRGKLSPRLKEMGKRYHAIEFAGEEMAHAFAVADIVIARAGMATITELAAMRKPAILIPLPHSPQEANAKILKEADAAIVLDQTVAGVGDIKAAALELLQNAKRREQMSRRIADVLPTDVAEKLVHHVRRHALQS